MPSGQPLVSIIIPCKNTADYFRRCLESIESQTYPNIEVIVVDNSSIDGTPEIASEFTDKVYEYGPERCSQFNYGFKQSSGEYIYRVDPDFVLEPDVVEKCVEKIEDGYDALALHNRSVGDSIWAEVRYYERESYVDDETIVAVRFMKREAFESVGMFDESLVVAEDYDLHNRIVEAGFKWTHVDAMEYHIGEPKSIIEVWKKFYYYGRTVEKYRRKNKAIAREHLVLFRPSFKKIQKDLRSSPKLFVAFYFYLLVKFFAAVFGYLREAPSTVLRGFGQPYIPEPQVSESGDGGMLKVLFLLWHSPLEVVSAGGFKRTSEILNRIPKDINIHVLDNGPSFLRDIKKENIHVSEYWIPNLLRRSEDSHFVLERVAEWTYAFLHMAVVCLRLKLAGKDYDVIFVPCSEIIPALFAGVSAKYILRRELILCNQNIEPFPPFVRYMLVKLHNRCDRVITVSNDLKKKLQFHGVNVPIVVNSNGLDTEYIFRTIDSRQVEKSYDGVFIGRHVEEKGMLDVVKVWNIVAKQYPNAKLLMIGSCNPINRAKLKCLIEGYGLDDRICVMGTVDEETKFLLIKESKICLFPSYIEGWGIVPQEGLACGLPVLVYDLPVYKENIEPCAATITVPIGDYESMARRAIELLSNEEYLRHEKVGPDFVKKFDWEKIASEEVRIIRQPQGVFASKQAE